MRRAASTSSNLILTRHLPTTRDRNDPIKIFEGSRTDGRFAKTSVFADGIYQAQSLGIGPNGDLYVVCTREVLILA
jgi:hypothetical protein